MDRGSEAVIDCLQPGLAGLRCRTDGHRRRLSRPPGCARHVAHAGGRSARASPIGTMQYRETLPLADHEVMLTFDDGPLPKYSNQILEILASQCVKATFFTVGRMARSAPEGVRKLRAAGHSIGTHTQNHPSGMKQMPIERARQEIDEGIASGTAALGEGAPA